MKKLICSIILLLVIVTCKKENKLSTDKNKEQTNSDIYFSATIDGEKLYSETPIYYKQQNVIMIAGHSKDKSEAVKMYIETKKEQTTYDFGKGINNSDNMIYVKNKTNWIASKVLGKGTVTFTEKGNYLVGSFSFIGVENENRKERKTIKGKFKINTKSK